MKKEEPEAPEAHYQTTGWAMILIGSVMMTMAVTMTFWGHADSQQDHVANVAIALIVILVGFWLKSHNEDDML